MAVGELRRSRICEDSQAVMDVRGAIAAMEMAEVMMSRRCMVVLPGWWLCSGYTGSCGRGALCPHSLFESKEGATSTREGGRLAYSAGFISLRTRIISLQAAPCS